MSKTSEKDISNKELAKLIGHLESKFDLRIDDLATMTQRGFHEIHEKLESHVQQSTQEHAEMLADNQHEHAETRSILQDKADFGEVVRQPDFDRLEQRVTQLELK